MAKINTTPLEGLIDNQLREHDYYSWCSFTRQPCLVTDNEIYDALLNPQKSPYFVQREFKTILQANATLLNMMFYAVYSGYLFSSIIEDERYDNKTWSYYYMHKKLNGHIYEPVFISLLLQIFDDKYEISDELKELYITDSRTVFSLVYRCIYSFISQTGLKNSNLFEEIDKESTYYKEELPDLLNKMHKKGVNIFYAGKQFHTRQGGKNLTSKNLWEDLNELE
jgi:hypothetical protein